MIFAIASSAQSNVHIKFMGIPVTGTIAQFQAKLVAKGCTYNKVASASISNGTRAFNGTFVGNINCKIILNLFIIIVIR